MKKSAALFFVLSTALMFSVQAQGVPPSSPGGDGQLRRQPMRDYSPEQREQWRDERRQRREKWQQMSPEERQQLRRDIRDSGQAFYPRGRPFSPAE